MNKPHPLASKLIGWFKTEKRALPWRCHITPYKVWVSEVMLQQTQVKTVIDYFNRWMQLLPTIQHLAEAPIELVLKLWEGLGYYSRARNLHQGAIQIMKEFNGIFPQDLELLLSIKGIGTYTASAILNFAYHKRYVLIDGNVKRVVSRLFDMAYDFSKPKHYSLIEHAIEKVLPNREFWIFNEALMELGALVCTPKKPNCRVCPLHQECKANLLNKQEELPLKKERPPTQKLTRAVLILEAQGHLLMKKETQNLMKDLYEFPYFEISDPKKIDEDPRLHFWQSQAISIKKLTPVKHSFTRFSVTLIPIHIKLSEKMAHDNYQWLISEDIKRISCSAGHRQILSQLDSF